MTVSAKRIDMCTGPILKNALIYTVPIILAGVLQLLFNAADLMIVGWFCGSNSVGAVGATGAMINLIINLFIGIASGVSVVTAKSIGARKQEETSRIVHTAVPLGIFSGIFLTVVGFFLSTPLLRLMDTPAELLPLSSIYTKIYFCGMVPNLLFNFCAAILRASGDTQSPMRYLSFAGIITVVLNIVCVTALRMDVAGVALATVIAQTVACFLSIRALQKREDACKFIWKKMKIYTAQLKSIVGVGLPAGIQSSVFSFSNVIIQSSVNSFGAAAVAGNAAGGNLEGFVYVSMNAFYQTSLNFTGQNLGAGKLDRVKQTLGTCLAGAVMLGGAMGLLFRLFAPELLSIYITDNPAAIAVGVKRMSYICATYFLCGAMEVLTGAIRGLGKSVVTLLISVIGVCGVRLGWIFTIFRIPQFHSLDSLYISYIISWLTCIVAMVVAYAILLKKLKEKMFRVTQ